MEHLTLQSFKEKVCECGLNGNGAEGKWKYKGDLPCVIDFYADWCGPCKAIAPVLEDLAKEYAGKLHIYKVNTENEADLSALFGIRSIPSLLFVPKDGDPQMAAGALSKEALKKAFKDILKV